MLWSPVRKVQSRFQDTRSIYRTKVAQSYPNISEGEIDLIEGVLNIEVPSDYRSFLKFWNGASLFFSSVEIWGKKCQALPKKANPSFDLTEHNMSWHSKRDVSASLIAFADYNFGDLLCLDFTDRGNNRIPDVRWDQAERKLTETWNSFTAWLNFEMLDGRENLFDYDGNEL